MLPALPFFFSGLKVAITLAVIAVLLFGAVCLVERLVCPWLAPTAEE